ncbi:hypothetical protein BGW39_001422 [Mortierella sp. 14UC]|nr:hypothetical protein BGW39_001422 [Mortierella sp. 14UC]
MLHLQADSVLEVTIHSAHDLQDVERGGDNDAYVRVYVDLNQNEPYKKTSVKKNSGSEPSWEESFELHKIRPEYTDLFVEILDEEKGTDAPIAFAAIPLSQLNDAPDKSLSARYDVYNKHGLPQGQISLTIRVVQPGQVSSGRITYDGSFKKGVSRVDEEQHKRFKKMVMKENMQDAGAATVLGGIAALGAGFLANTAKKASESKKHDEAEDQ